MTFTTDEAQFIANNPGLAFQDFAVANAPAGLIINCNPGIINSATNDPCFMPGDILPGIEFSSSTLSNDLLVLGSNAAGSGNPADVLTNNTFPDSYNISFTDPNVRRAGMLMGCARTGAPCSENMTVEVYGAGNVFLNSTIIPVTNLFNTFLGVTSIVPITRINLLASNTPVEGLLNIRFGEGFTPELVSLSPEFATNDIFTDHTVTATIISNGSPVQGVLVSFEVTSGPNAGQSSDPGSGECASNDDCTTDIDGRVSWTYTGSKFPGTDTIVATIEGGETLTAEKLWVSPARPIPTLSEWGMISAAAGLGLIGVLFAVRRKKARAV